MQQGEASLPRSTSISRESLKLLCPLLLQAFVYPAQGLAETVMLGAYVQSPVVKWIKTYFLSRSSDARKEHILLLLRASKGPSVQPRVCSVMVVRSVAPFVTKRV